MQWSALRDWTFAIKPFVAAMLDRTHPYCADACLAPP
jgi:hypothetical protein